MRVGAQNQVFSIAEFSTKDEGEPENKSASFF